MSIQINYGVKDRSILKSAIDKYGVDMQLNVAIEELSELTKELCKYKRGYKNQNEIAEEIADVYITLKQCEIIFVNHYEVVSWINKKIERLEQNLGEV